MAQIQAQLFRRSLEILGNARKALLNFAFVDVNLVGLGFLDLKRFIDQITQHLHAQPFTFFIGDLAAIGEQDQRQTLINICPGDDVSVHDGGWLAQIGSTLPNVVKVDGRFSPHWAPHHRQ